MAAKKYRFGIIGCGEIWRIMNWPKGLKLIPESAQVVSVYDIDPAAAAAAAAATGGCAVDCADAILDDKGIDIIAILTPPFARLDYVRRACAAGKHLVVEKPFSRTLEDALSMYSCVRKNKIKCAVPFGRAGSALWQEAVRIVHSGELGHPVGFVHTNLATPWSPMDHWMNDAELSGGPIFDYSIHFIELARAAIGAEAVWVNCTGVRKTNRVKCDDHAVLSIEFDNGCFGQLTKSCAFPPGIGMHHEYCCIVCEEGVIVLSDDPPAVYTPQGKRELNVTPTHPGRAPFFLNLIDAIENDTPLFASELEGLRTIEILDAALKSRSTRKTEKVELHNTEGVLK